MGGVPGLVGRLGPGITGLGWSIFEEFVRSRTGVEAFLEPRTNVTENTVILIAADGEWTRRRISDPGSARRFFHQLGTPIYDVRLTGYPQRMRDYNARRKALEH